MAGLIRLYRPHPVQCYVQCYVHTKDDYVWSLVMALASGSHDIRAVYKESSPSGITEDRTNRLAGEIYKSRREWPIEERA